MKKTWYFIPVALLITSCAGTPSGPAADGTQPHRQTPPAETIVYNMPTISFVTTDSPQRMGYISLTLLAGPPVIRQELTNTMDSLSVAVNALMCKKKAAQLDSVDDLEHLKVELLDELNGKLKTGTVVRITIREIVVN